MTNVAKQLHRNDFQSMLARRGKNKMLINTLVSLFAMAIVWI